MKGEEILEVVTEKFPDVKPQAGTMDATAIVPANRLLEVAKFARDDARLKFDLLSIVSGVDLEKSIESVYHLDSTVMRHWLVLKVQCDRANPRVPSVTGVWPAANWHEREAYDMVGIVYEGHPNLMRILLPEDWEGFPLRKDYVQPDEYHGIPNDFKQKGKVEKKWPFPA